VSFKCPTCDSDAGIREAIYGLPQYPLDEDKYFIAGCTTIGPEFVCVKCGWGLGQIKPWVPDGFLKKSQGNLPLTSVTENFWLSIHI